MRRATGWSRSLHTQSRRCNNLRSPLTNGSLTRPNAYRRHGGTPNIGYPNSVRLRTAVTSRHEYAGPTIFALSTPPGRSAIAVIRLSGPACLEIYRALCPTQQDPRPRCATIRTLYSPGQPQSQSTVLDPSALILYFPHPRTVTGEDVLELHVHGGPAVVKAVLRAIPQCHLPLDMGGLRFAEPGEFTKRAFLNNRLALTQVEALGDTLSATTEQQRRLSVRGASGALAKRYDAWRQQLLLARGELEALIDFSEDQHFDESTSDLLAAVSAQVRVLVRVLETHVQNAVRGELLRNGISISLLGAPNAGKSSLLNRIVGREAAIVSQEAGTTRDIVEVGLDLGGYFCRLGDTAGLRQAKKAIAGSQNAEELIGQIEKEGMRRAKQRAAESDAVVVVLSLQRSSQGVVKLHLDPEVIATAAQLVQDKDNIVVAINKIDMADSADQLDSAVAQTLQTLPGLHPHRIFLISCRELTAALVQEPALHAGAADPGHVQSLLQGLVAYFHSLTAAVSSSGAEGGASVDVDADADADAHTSIWQESLGATERHRLLLERCIESLNDFMAVARAGQAGGGGGGGGDGDGDGAEEEADVVVAAEHLRSAADCLAKITGRGEAGDVEEVLGVVFEKFCVGK